jgi:hypothetical protein
VVRTQFFVQNKEPQVQNDRINRLIARIVGINDCCVSREIVLNRYGNLFMLQKGITENLVKLAIESVEHILGLIGSKRDCHGLTKYGQGANSTR